MKHIVWLAILIACDRGEHRAAREKYNEGVELLVKADYDGAEKALIDACSNAGVDPELRFRAAYDLGTAYARRTPTSSRPARTPISPKALDLEQQAAWWFGDASRQRPGDADAKANLAIVTARVQALSDELRRGEGKLEARLDTVIGEQRNVLEEARTAWREIKLASGNDPLAQRNTLTHLADEERGIVAEAGVIGDLADDEIDSIGKKAQDKRTQDEQVRVVQLKNLDQYLTDARSKIAEARRKLQDLAAEDGVARAEAALESLKRAREQLLDPITVLREVARDELETLQQTQAVADVDGSHKVLDTAGSGSSAAAKPLIPAWMEPAALGERQGGLHDRAEEVRTPRRRRRERRQTGRHGLGSRATEDDARAGEDVRATEGGVAVPHGCQCRDGSRTRCVDRPQAARGGRRGARRADRAREGDRAVLGSQADDRSRGGNPAADRRPVVTRRRREALGGRACESD